MSFNFSLDGILKGSGDSEADPFVMHFDNIVGKGNADELEDGLSAIYFFYSLRYVGDNPVSRLLYIGKAIDLKKRIKDHEKNPKKFPEAGAVEIEDLEDYLCDPEDVKRQCVYAYAKVDGRRLERFEAAAIKVFQPEINIKNKKSLGCHEESWFKCTGKYAYAKDKVQHAVPDKQ